MLSLVVRRLLQSIPLALAATVLVFLVMRFIPGDPAAVYAGPEAPRESVEAVRKEFGLDKPLPVQYTIWLKNVLNGDLGESYLSKLPVTTLIGQRIPATLELTTAAMLITIVVGIPTGVIAALRSRTAVDWAITSYSSISVAIPSFWLGILAIYLFAQQLGWLPPGGRGESLTSDPIDAMKHLLLPALTLSTVTAATLSRITKSAVLEVLYEDYVRTANAKGLREWQVVIRHVLRNAMVPVVTIAGLQVGQLLGGAVVIEAVYAWPGVGRMILGSLASRDYAVVQGALLSLVFVYIFVNLLTDILYGVIDPRIRVGAKSAA